MGARCCKGADQKRIDEYVNKAARAINQGESNTALQLCDTALGYDSQHAYAYHVKGMAYTALHKYDTAVECFDKAIRINGKFKQAYLNKGVALHTKGNHEAAETCCASAIAVDPKYKNAYNLKGAAHHQRQEYSKAIECYDEALRIDPNYEAARKNKKSSEIALREAPTEEKASKSGNDGESEAKSNAQSSFRVIHGKSSRDVQSEEQNQQANRPSASSNKKSQEQPRERGRHKSSKKARNHKTFPDEPAPHRTKSRSKPPKADGRSIAGRSKHGRAHSKRNAPGRTHRKKREIDSTTTEEAISKKDVRNTSSTTRANESAPTSEESPPFSLLAESVTTQINSTDVSSGHGMRIGSGNDDDSRDDTEEPQDLNDSSGKMHEGGESGSNSQSLGKRGDLSTATERDDPQLDVLRPQYRALQQHYASGIQDNSTHASLDSNITKSGREDHPLVQVENYSKGKSGLEMDEISGRNYGTSQWQYAPDIQNNSTHASLDINIAKSGLEDYPSLRQRHFLHGETSSGNEEIPEQKCIAERGKRLKSAENYNPRGAERYGQSVVENASHRNTQNTPLGGGSYGQSVMEDARSNAGNRNAHNTRQGTSGRNATDHTTNVALTTQTESTLPTENTAAIANSASVSSPPTKGGFHGSRCANCESGESFHGFNRGASPTCDDIDLLPGSPLHQSPQRDDISHHMSRCAPKTVLKLFKAAKRRDFNAIRTMASSSDCLSTTDAAGNTVLHKLLKGESLDDHAVAESILEDEDITVNPNIQDANGKTLLHIAAETGSAHIVDTLLAIGADPNILDKERKTMLKYVVERKQLSLYQYLLRIYENMFDMSVASNSEASMEARTSFRMY